MPLRKSPKELTDLFWDMFPTHEYFLQFNKETLVLRTFTHGDDTPFIDEDGSYLGGINYRINFFVFPSGREKQVTPEWMVEDIRQWSREKWREVAPDRRYWEESEADQDLDRRLRRYWSDGFIQWLMNKYPDLSVRDEYGTPVKKRNSITIN